MLMAGFASLAVSPFIANVHLACVMTLLILVALVFDVVGVPTIFFLLHKIADAKEERYAASSCSRDLGMRHLPTNSQRE